LEGTQDLLKELAGRGCRIVLATSAGGPEPEALRRAIDADDVMAGVTSADEVPEGKAASWWIAAVPLLLVSRGVRGAPCHS
jgi:phosphoglycolate phosphatase-like HAD superfamily hydrolase